MGAAGRDFYNFNVVYRNNRNYKVVCFTATQIPGISGRVYPKELAGRLYPKGIPIYPEEKLSQLIKKFKINQVVFSYSDVSHEEVMHKASIALSNGADFVLLGPRSTMLESSKPVISVTAVRTGSGKSQTTRKISQILIKKREEYEPHIKNRIVVYAGVDYEKILKQAEKEADVIIWDGGNNDFSFIKSDLYIVVVDPHRAGHELRYHPGETNLRMADVVIVNKIDSAQKSDIYEVIQNTKSVNPKAKIILAKSLVTVDRPELIKRKSVLVVEDGPTLTHGGMPYGAGTVAAKKYNCKIIDARKYAVGSIKNVYKTYLHLKKELPAMGYSKKQIQELEKTINSAKCDAVIDATPVNLLRLIKINKPVAQVNYELQEVGKLDIEKILRF